MPSLRISRKKISRLSDSQKKLLGKELLRSIRRRTRRGKDKNGEDFEPYSKSYANSSLFKKYGKNKDEVNLMLTKDLMYYMKVIEIGENYIELGWDDKELRKRATHMIEGEGRYNVPKRDFLGLSDTEINTVLANFEPERETEQSRLLKYISLAIRGDSDG